MKLCIFGATGTVGRELVRQALALGHQVTAFTRAASKIPLDHHKLKTHQGDVLDYASVEQAVQGHDAVLCTIGAGTKGQLRDPGTRNIVRAMEQSRVERLICQSTLGVGESWQNLNFFWKYIMFKGLLRRVYTDHVAQEAHVTDSRLNWTIVRPAAFTDGEHTGEYRHGFPSCDRDTELKISRADVADFMLKQLTDDIYFRDMPGISY